MSKLIDEISKSKLHVNGSASDDWIVRLIDAGINNLLREPDPR